ncbi:MAG: metal ABC transporter substrate-binding protein [Deltaproteobacteria bacterium]|nr:metal ABC transporter substrate-binding protein [Deltaproteobacteria bacterium]
MNKVKIFFPVLFFVLASVNPLSASGEERKKIKVLTSFLPVYIFTLNVVGESDRIDVACLIAGEAGPHDYQMRPSDMRKVEDADFIIINGLGIEEFLGDLIAGRKTKGTLLESASGLPLLETGAHKEEEGHDDHPHHGEHNPHTWVSPKLAAMQVMNIAKFLSAIDPAGAAIYMKNGEKYADSLNRLNEEIKTMVAALPDKRIVTVHNAFDYLARDTGLHVVSVIYHRPGEGPSASEMGRLTAMMRKEKVKALFTEPLFSEKRVRVIAKESGARVGALDPVATGDPSKELYHRLMRKNMTVLKEMLSPQPK